MSSQIHDALTAGLVRLLGASPGVGSVRVMHTHISTVILAGEYAYKLKKPLRLPFLDFSTLALRRHFCDEELRLNRRTAPQLYLDVLPITGSLDEPIIGGGGEAIEWVLRMRRFSTRRVFKSLASAGRLLPAHIDDLAKHMAAFHLGLPAIPSEDLPDKDTWQWASESLDEIAAHEGLRADGLHNDVAELRSQLRLRFQSLAGRHAQRREQGRLRECHGDLHLGNIVVWQGQVIAFDALEFDFALRCIDPINDLAFTFMDLHVAQLPALAWRLVNAYVEQTGDFDGLCLLRAYAAYRATVRAKVALLGADGLEGFHRYWPWSRQFAAAPATPRLTLVSGLSGSGKSTVACQLAAETGAVHLRSDVERKRLHGVGFFQRPTSDTSLYTGKATRDTYGRLGELSARLLADGLSVVVDAAFLRHDEREAMRELAAQTHAAFALIECVAPMAEMAARIVARASRNDDVSDATPDVLARQQQFVQPFPPDWAGWRHVLVNDGDLNELHEKIASLVKDFVQERRLPPTFPPVAVCETIMKHDTSKPSESSKSPSVAADSFRKETSVEERDKVKDSVADKNRRSMMGAPVDPHSPTTKDILPPGVKREDVKDPGRATPGAGPVDNRSGQRKP